MRTAKYVCQDYKTNEDTIWELKIKPDVKKIQNYRNKWIQHVWWMNRQRTTLSYEISTTWETKSRMTPQKTSQLLMVLEKVMRPKSLQAIWWWSSLQKPKDYNYFTTVLKVILHGL